ncbi:hypothetical protein LTR66_005875 [Elasticomyces elasticus]|nr:hypothetical protein LTR66_005875 [Elasticomyces elasticus]
MAQTLSSKESSLFRHLVQNYESKQYKKGLRAAEQILRKVPNHGDTQAMKALILNAQGQGEEAFALAKIALKNAMKSHVCWHVYGLLYRSVKNYEEAIKAYRFALRLDPESVQIQRDLALLQVHMRDYQGFLQSRRAMLTARPGLRQNWTAMAIAHHLAGELAAAENVLNTYEETLKSPPPKSDIEHAEAVLYKNTIIAESGDVQRALEHLDAVSKCSNDRSAIMEMRARYLLQLGRKEEAEKAYRALLARNDEYRAYYDGLENALGLSRTDEASREKLHNLYKSYAEKSERVDAARRIPLDFLHQEDFREAADTYLRRKLQRGVHSTFTNVKALYRDAAKLKIISELVDGYSTESLPNGSAGKQTNGNSSKHWDLALAYFLAQHYDHPLVRDSAKATEWIEKAIELGGLDYTYTMTKARIWKHQGNTAKAAEIMEVARSMDAADRYINTKCAKYQLRNDEHEAAIQTMGKFTRKEAVGGSLGDLIDMQCGWFIAEDGESYLRQRNYGLALKRFKTIYDIFEAWQEDQFDFHSFSLRKGQIRAYIDMLRWEDHLRDHPFFTRAALPAIQIYVLLNDKPHFAEESQMNGTAGDSAQASERKRAQKKAKKEQQKSEAEKAANKKPNTGADAETKKEDPDPQGVRLAQTKEPLEEALKWLAPLLELSPKNIAAQTAGFEVFIRRNKHLLALKCLLATHSLDPDSAALHVQTVRFRQALDNLSEPLPENVSQVIKSTFEEKLLPPSTSLSDFNSSFLSKHKNSASHVQATLRVCHMLDASRKQQNEQDLQATLDLPLIQIHEATEALLLLDEWESAPSVRKAYLDAAKRKWPEATAFQRAS